jgi:uncharacterized protein YndB with AHSA1/START domain
MATQAAQVSTEVKASVETVWKALTTAEVLGAAFFGSEVKTSWRVGSPILFLGDWKGKKFQDKGEIKVVAPLERLRFTHWSPLSGTPDAPESYHIVTFDLAPAGGSTKVTLTQENVSDAEVGAEARKELAKNWTQILDNLRKAIEGGAGASAR